jgi:hypothetical protein
MADFAEYQKTTDTINTIVSTQLSSVLSWINVPGGLTKASSSSAGFVWGFNSSGEVYMSPLPSTGNWTLVDLKTYNVSQILDIATDETNVYILYSNSSGTGLIVTPVNNQGTPLAISVPFSATSIFSTHTYIWAQDVANNKQRCPKPCTMKNWQAVAEHVVEITSSDDSSLYGKDLSGNAMQTDETMQSAWQPLDDIKGTVFGKGSDGTIYGIDSSQQGFQYNGNIQPLFTNGLQPTNITVEPQTNQLWMTTSSPGAAGNVFTRVQKPDYTTTMNLISPLDKSREKTVDEIETRFIRETDVMTVNKQVKDVVRFFTKMFHIDGTTAKKAVNQIGVLNDHIRDSQTQLDEIHSIEPLLFGVMGIMIVILLVYMFLPSLFGSYVHIISLGIAGIGTFLLLNFSVGNK